MTALKITLFHDEISDNFDVASCTQKIASWDTILDLDYSGYHKNLIE